MRLKVVNKKSLVVGALLIAISASYIVVDRYYNYKQAETIKEVASSWVASITPTKIENKEPLIDDVIEVVTENQEIEEVDSYVNCISIPDLNILARINEGVDSDALHTGVGHFEESVLAGEVGNFCIAGHASDTYNCVFNRLKEINIFDTIDIYDSQGRKYEYTVISTTVVQPDYVRVLDTKVSSDKKEMTVITCTDKGQRRLVVKAEILSESKLAELKQNQRNSLLDVAEQYNNLVSVSNLYDYLAN